MAGDQLNAEGVSRRVASFDIRYTQYLDMEGRPVQPLPALADDPEQIVSLYRAMVLHRTFDAKAIALQRTGSLGTYAPCLGQEAVFAAVGAVMREEDVLVPYYRECGAQLLRGVTMTELLLYWGGDERGMNFEGPRGDFPCCVPIASQIPHAAGVAMAMKYRGEPRVTVTVFGDGAMSKGEFYETANAAAVWNLPLVFVANNNQWAISVPRNEQTRCETLAQKAVAAGFAGEQVDGNDLIAVMTRLSAAIDKARDGGGPTLIEAVTYRLSDHTTADDASRYRSEAEVEENRQYDPVIRIRRYLVNNAYWNDDKEQRLEQECREAVEQAVQAYLDTPPRAPESMFDHLYEKLPVAYAGQRDELVHKGEKS